MTPQVPSQVSRLVLSRRIGESIQIDGPCVVKIVDVDPRDGRVRIVVETERHVTIMQTKLLSRREIRAEVLL